MRIHWLYLLLALALMVPPTPFPTDFRKALRRSNVSNPGGVAWLWQNWWDLFRAALGVYFLTERAIVVGNSDQPGAELLVLTLKAAVLGVVLLAQTIRVLRTVQLLAPVFYLCGLTLTMSGYDSHYLPGAFAVGVGWLFAIGGKNLAYQMPAMAVATAVASYVLGPPLPLLVNCALILVPLLLSVLFKKRLWFAASSPVGA